MSSKRTLVHNVMVICSLRWNIADRWMWTWLPLMGSGLAWTPFIKRKAQGKSPCNGFPLLHQEGVQNILFSWFRILVWMFNGVCSSVIIFFFSSHSILHQAFRSDGRTADFEVLGVLMYTCVVWTVNCQMALVLRYFTWIQHFFIWGSIIFWYIFLAIYGSIPTSISTSAYKVLVEACGSAPIYWLSTLFVVVSALLPYFSYAALQTSFFPPYHVIIQIMSKEESVSRASVGFSARFEARLRHMKERLHHRQS